MPVVAGRQASPWSGDVICCQRNYRSIEVCEQIRNTKFNFKKANFVGLYNCFRDCDWTILKSIADVNIAVAHFYNTVGRIFEECVPLATQVGRVFPVWFNMDIIRMIRQKEKYYRVYKRKLSSYWYKKYSDIRRVIKLKIGDAHTTYLNNVQESIYKNPKYFWSYIKTQKRNPDVPVELHLDKTKFTGTKDAANGFALYFGSVYSPAEQFDSVGIENKKYFCRVPVSRMEILEAIGKLNGNRAVGPDGVPGYVIKGCGEFLVDPLLHICDLCFGFSVFPDMWRTSKVVPIFKCGSRNQINNYRPITIVSSIAKVFEIVLFNRIYNEVKHKIVYNQHGFLPKRSTLTNLIAFTEFIHGALKSRAQVDVIYTDLEKAFDKVKHGVILQSLESMQVSGYLTNLVKSYLTPRGQYVELKGGKSEIYLSTSGVPQGSNLGPLLFLVAFNGIAKNIKHSNATIFADDFKLYVRVLTVGDCERMQEDLDGVSEWCGVNGFKMNVNKCVCMTFSLKSCTVPYSYRIGNNVLERKECHRDLGVWYDSNLSFNEHISAIVSDAFKVMGFVIRSAKTFNIDVCLKLFDSLVSPKLEYCTVVWSPYYCVWSNLIESVQRRFLKFMYLKRFGNYPVRGFCNRELLAAFDRLSMENRRIRICLLTLYRVLKNSIDSPDILASLPFAVRRMNARNKLTFYLEFPRTNLYKNSPIYRMCDLYNEYANDIDVTVVGYVEFREFVTGALKAVQSQSA